jgi:hypothetical protein
MYNYQLIFVLYSDKNHCNFKHLSKINLKNKHMRENNELLKDNLKKARIYDDETLENMKKYYNINDHTDLLKFIKLNGIMNHDYDKE